MRRSVGPFFPSGREHSIRAPLKAHRRSATQRGLYACSISFSVNGTSHLGLPMWPRRPTAPTDRRGSTSHTLARGCALSGSDQCRLLSINGSLHLRIGSRRALSDANGTAAAHVGQRRRSMSRMSSMYARVPVEREECVPFTGLSLSFPRGVLKIEEAVRMAFDSGSVPRRVV